MGRSGYVDDYDEEDYPNAVYLWQRAVENAIAGRRGQAFLHEMLEALEAMPVKRLIAEELEQDGEVCAIGSVGRKRGIDMKPLDPENHKAIAKTFRIAPILVREIEYTNDDDFAFNEETPEQRYERVVKWVREQIKP